MVNKAHFGEHKTHFKMYKKGKIWVTAGITTVMLAGNLLGSFSSATIVQAATAVSDAQASSSAEENVTSSTPPIFRKRCQ